MEQRELRKQKIAEYMKDHPDFVDEPTPISKNRKQFIDEYIAMHQLQEKLVFQKYLNIFPNLRVL